MRKYLVKDKSDEPNKGVTPPPSRNHFNLLKQVGKLPLMWSLHINLFWLKRWVHLDNRSVIESDVTLYTHFALGCINIYIYVFDASTRRRL